MEQNLDKDINRSIVEEYVILNHSSCSEEELKKEVEYMLDFYYNYFKVKNKDGE